jgi:hypothetical protein
MSGSLIACARPNGPPTATAIEVAPASPAAPPSEAPVPKGACLVRERASTLDLKVPAGGGRMVDLRITDLPTESELAKDGIAVVHVGGPIRFVAHVELAQRADSPGYVLRTTRNLVVLGGLVRLGESSELVGARRVEDAAMTTALISGYAVDGVPVPCEELAIAYSEPRGNARMEDVETSWVKAHGDRVTVCATPALASPCVTVHEMTFEEMSRKSGVVEVGARFDDQSEIHGWVKEDDVMRSEPPEPVLFGSTGGCGCGHGQLPHLRMGKPDPREHFGKARLLAGSAIYATSELTFRWGTAAAEVEIEIAMLASDDYARVTNLPGISTHIGCACPGLDENAFVKREAVVPMR